MNYRGIIIYALVFCLGVYLGSLVIRVPFISLEKSVNIIELGNLILLVTLSLFIPFFITKKIDNVRIQKNMLMEEIGLLCTYLESIEETLEQHQGSVLSPKGHREILNAFKKSRQCLSIVEEQVKAIFFKKTSEKIELLKSKMEIYWSSMTGDEGIKPAGFSINSGFIWENRMLQLDVSREARMLKFCINDA